MWNYDPSDRSPYKPRRAQPIKRSKNNKAVIVVAGLNIASKSGRSLTLQPGGGKGNLKCSICRLGVTNEQFDLYNGSLRQRAASLSETYKVSISYQAVNRHQKHYKKRPQRGSVWSRRFSVPPKVEEEEDLDRSTASIRLLKSPKPPTAYE